MGVIGTQFRGVIVTPCNIEFAKNMLKSIGYYRIGVKLYDTQRLFSEKLRRLSLACDCMMKALAASMGRAAGADDMMPALIFLLLHSNPPLFKSNLALIRRLAPPETLRRF